MKYIIFMYLINAEIFRVSYKFQNYDFFSEKFSPDKKCKN